jgi:hypothetical protein
MDLIGLVHFYVMSVKIFSASFKVIDELTQFLYSLVLVMFFLTNPSYQYPYTQNCSWYRHGNRTYFCNMFKFPFEKIFGAIFKRVSCFFNYYLPRTFILFLLSLFDLFFYYIVIPNYSPVFFHLLSLCFGQVTSIFHCIQIYPFKKVSTKFKHY